jgi:hypothetical protein
MKNKQVDSHDRWKQSDRNEYKILRNRAKRYRQNRMSLRKYLGKEDKK